MSNDANDRQTPENDESAETSSHPDDDTRRGGHESEEPAGLAGWFSETAVRLILAFVGVVLVLLAIGQLTGYEVYAWMAEFVSSPPGQWVAVALIGLVLVIVASKRWGLAGHSQ